MTTSMEKSERTRAAHDRRSHLVGNRWVLIGGILYLLEIAALVLTGADGVATPAGSAEKVIAVYDGSTGSVALLAGLLSVVLLGRVLYFVGLRSALTSSGRPHLLMDFAVVAATVTVALELTAHGLTVAAADFADRGDTATTVLLDQAGAYAGSVMYGAMGAAVLASAWCMWQSALFARTLVLIGAAGGAMILTMQFFIGPDTTRIADQLSLGVILFWIWMVWTGVVAWRRAPRSA